MSDLVHVLGKLTIAEMRLRTSARVGSPSLLLAEQLKKAREDIEQLNVQRPPKPMTDEEQDTAALIKDEGDLIITILKTFKTSADERKKFKRLYDTIKSAQTLLKDVGAVLVDALGGSDEELKDLDQSSVGAIQKALDNESKELGELLDISQLLKNYERKATTDRDLEPVKHKLPKKDRRAKDKSKVEGEKPKEKTKTKDEAASRAKEHGTDKELEELLK